MLVCDIYRHKKSRWDKSTCVCEWGWDWV